MKPIDYALRCVAVVCVVVAVSCVDESYNLNEVSTEVTVISNKTKLFVGELEQKRIGDLLGDAEVEGLTKDENGNFTFNYSGEGEPQKIEGVSASYTVPGTENRFTVEYPSFNFDMNGIVINEEADVVVNDDFIAKLPYSGEIPSSMVSSIPNIKGSFNKEFKGEDMHLVFDLPEQVDNIKMITFKDIESGHHGAPMHLTVGFNGLAGINGGGVVNFRLSLEGGEFRIVDASGNLLVEGNEYVSEYAVEAGADKVDFVVYVESIENTTQLNAEHQLDIPLALTCDMSFDLNVKAGNFNLNDMPHFELNADFEFGDAEILMNGEASLVEYHPEEPQQVRIENLPKELKAISKIELKDGAVLNFYADGLEWLDDNAEKVAVEVFLPEYLVLHAVNGAGYEYDEHSHKLTTTIADINDGVELTIDALDFGEGLVPDAEGVITLALAFDMNAHFAEGENIKVSELVHEQNLEIKTGIEDITLDVESVTGKVDYTYTLKQDFAIKTEDLNIGEVKVEGVGLSPVITLNIDNPLTVPLAASGYLKDDTGRELKLSDMELKAAAYENGVVVPAKNKIVIANERPDYDCTYIDVDFDELLKGTIPSLLSVELEVGVNSDNEQTLYVADEFVINYDYSIDVPVAINDKLSVSYADEFGGFGDIFAQIADYNVKVGDVVLIAEITNTTPLALLADVDLLDKDGEAVDLTVEFDKDNGRINGSADGVTPAVSTMRLNITNDNGSGIDVATLAVVDGFAFEVSASSDAEGDVALREEQYIGAKLWLELDGGITVDIKDFIQSNN